MIEIGTNIIDVKRHNEIKERGLRLAEVLEGEEKELVMSIVNESKEFIRKEGKKDNVVLDPSSRRLSTFQTAVKRYVRSDFIEPSLSRIKVISALLQDVDGICDECMKHAKQFNEEGYDLCNDCEKKFQFRFSIHCVQWERYRMIERDFIRAVENTDFPDKLVGNWLLLMKKKRQEKESKHIDKVLKQFIRDELVKDFTNKNKQLLKKYELWQNQ